MREASELQRRRRLMMMVKGKAKASNRASADALAGAVGEPEVALDSEEALQAARQQLFRDCLGRSGLHAMIEVSGEAHSRRLSLDKPWVLIGSGETCDLLISGPPRRIHMQWIEGNVYCCNLASTQQGRTTGAWISRKPVTVGSIRISIPDIELPSGISDPLARNSELAAEVPQVQLTFGGVEQADNLWPVDRQLTLIGRGPNCRLRLDHPEIPLVLAGLIRTPASCWLINMNQGGRLDVNGREIELVSLDIGDVIRLGPFTAEVGVAPFSLKTPRPRRGAERFFPDVHELADQHRQKIGTLNKSLESVKKILEAKDDSAIPELMTALQRYISQAQSHHREIQAALDRFLEPAGAT